MLIGRILIRAILRRAISLPTILVIAISLPWLVPAAGIAKTLI
jgi:hypothetical protein